MAYPTCKIKNISGNELTLHGKVFSIGEIYVLPDQDRVDWATEDTVITAITSDNIQVGDSDTWFESYAAQIAHLQTY